MNTPAFPISTDSIPSTAEETASSSSPGRGWLRSPLGLLAFAGVSVLAAAVGARVTIRNKPWYGLLRKSPLTPPDRAFSVVWPVLYSLGAVSAWRVARTPSSPERTRALALWGTQLAFNAGWTPIFFGAHRPALAMADVVANSTALAAYAVEARRSDPLAAAMVLPNLAWLALAATLNAGVLSRNRGPYRLLLRG